MNTPVRRRRQSPAVYRRRRLALLLLLVCIAVIVWVLIAQPWRGAADNAPAPEPTPTASASVAEAEPSASPSPVASDGVIPDCTPADVTVEAVTDQTTYAADQQPQFSIRLTNTGAACTMNVGTTTQSFIVTSGSESYWRSTDCQVEPSDMTVTIEAGQTVTSAAPIVWDRTRSSVDSCDGVRAAAPADGASYHLAVAIGGITSADTAQFILD